MEDEDTLQQNNLGTLHKDVALQGEAAAVGKGTHVAPVDKYTSRAAVAAALRDTLVVVVVVDKQMNSL